MNLETILDGKVIAVSLAAILIEKNGKKYEVSPEVVGTNKYLVWTVKEST